MTAHAGLVSTIIPVYNRQEMLIDAVESVISQTYRPIEIIIVNDGSTDDTLNVAKKLAHKYHEVSLITIHNSGPGVAREHGRLNAQGEFIQYLDSDDLLAPQKFEQQVKQLVINPDFGVSYCIQQYCTLDLTVIDPKWMRTSEHFKTMFPAMLGGRIWGTPAPLYRSKLLEQAGPWRDLKNQEDWEYDCRVASLGVELGYIPETLVTIRSHNEEHFGKVDKNDNRKLSDRIKAYQFIYNHAITANIDNEHPEFQKFNRSLFLICRQSASHGLIADAKVLIQMASTSTTSPKRKFEYKLYKLLSTLFGWSRIGKLSAQLDRVRN